MLVDQHSNLPAIELDVAHEIAVLGEDFWGVEHGAGAVGGGVVLQVGIAAWSPVVDEGFEGVPVGVSAGGLGLADAGLAVADADGGERESNRLNSSPVFNSLAVVL